MSIKEEKKPVTVPKKIKNYTLDKIVNRLPKSVIYEGTNKIIDEKVLIKVYNKELIKYKSEEILKINNEIFLLKLINHTNILRIYEIIESPTFIFIIFEYFNGIKLTDFIKTNGKTSEEKAFHIYCQIVSIITYIHDINICHLNLNPEIFLIDQDYNIKLCDFIYGEMYNKSDKKTNYEDEIINKYSCPQIHIKKPYDPEEADIWSSGVLIYYILMGELPFDEVNKYDLLKSILKADVYLPKSMSYNWQIMIKSLLELKESKRYKLKYLFLSPLFKENFIKKAQIENGLIIPINNDLINICHNFYGINNEKLIDDLNKNVFNKETSLYKQILNICKNKKIIEIDDKDHENETKEIDENDLDTDRSQILNEKEILKKEKILNNINIYFEKQKNFKKIMDNIVKNQESILKNLDGVKAKYLIQQKKKNEKTKNIENSLHQNIKITTKPSIKSRSNNDLIKIRTISDNKTRIYHRNNNSSLNKLNSSSNSSLRHSKNQLSDLSITKKKKLLTTSKKYESPNKIIEAKKEDEESQKPLIELRELQNQIDMLKIKNEIKKNNDLLRENQIKKVMITNEKGEYIMVDESEVIKKEKEEDLKRKKLKEIERKKEEERIKEEERKEEERKALIEKKEKEKIEEERKKEEEKIKEEQRKNDEKIKIDNNKIFDDNNKEDNNKNENNNNKNNNIKVNPIINEEINNSNEKNKNENKEKEGKKNENQNEKKKNIYENSDDSYINENDEFSIRDSSDSENQINLDNNVNNNTSNKNISNIISNNNQNIINTDNPKIYKNIENIEHLNSLSPDKMKNVNVNPIKLNEKKIIEAQKINNENNINCKKNNNEHNEENFKNIHEKKNSVERKKSFHSVNSFEIDENEKKSNNISDDTVEENSIESSSSYSSSSKNVPKNDDNNNIDIIRSSIKFYDENKENFINTIKNLNHKSGQRIENRNKSATPEKTKLRNNNNNNNKNKINNAVKNTKIKKTTKSNIDLKAFKSNKNLPQKLTNSFVFEKNSTKNNFKINQKICNNKNQAKIDNTKNNFRKISPINRPKKPNNETKKKITTKSNNDIIILNNNKTKTINSNKKVLPKNATFNKLKEINNRSTSKKKTAYKTKFNTNKPFVTDKNTNKKNNFNFLTNKKKSKNPSRLVKMPENLINSQIFSNAGSHHTNNFLKNNQNVTFSGNRSTVLTSSNFSKINSNLNSNKKLRIDNNNGLTISGIMPKKVNDFVITNPSHFDINVRKNINENLNHSSCISSSNLHEHIDSTKNNPNIVNINNHSQIINSNINTINNNSNNNINIINSNYYDANNNNNNNYSFNMYNILANSLRDKNSTYNKFQEDFNSKNKFNEDINENYKDYRFGFFNSQLEENVNHDYYGKSSFDNSNDNIMQIRRNSCQINSQSRKKRKYKAYFDTAILGSKIKNNFKFKTNSMTNLNTTYKKKTNIKKILFNSLLLDKNKNDEDYINDNYYQPSSNKYLYSNNRLEINNISGIKHNYEDKNDFCSILDTSIMHNISSCKRNINRKEFINSKEIITKLKTQLKKISTELKNEKSIEDLKLFKGPIDIKMISLKKNIKESYTELKNIFKKKGYGLLAEKDGKLFFEKKTLIYACEVVKINSNLLYYLVKRQKYFVK